MHSSLSKLMQLASIRDPVCPTTRLDNPDFVITFGTNVVSISPLALNLECGGGGGGAGDEEQGLVLCVITGDGCVSLWTLNGKKKLFEIDTELAQVTAGEMVLKQEKDSKSFLMLQSRQSGINLFTFFYPVGQPSLKKIPTKFPLHVGFCRMVRHSDIFLLPTHQDRFGVLSLAGVESAVMENCAPVLLKEEDTLGVIMFIKVITTWEGKDFILFGSEPGTVHVQGMHKISHSEGEEGQRAHLPKIELTPWNAQLNVNDAAKAKHNHIMPSRDAEEDELVTPMCAEARLCGVEEDVVIIGTNTKYLYLIKLDMAEKKMSFEGRKCLMNKGVNCLCLHQDGKLLAIGGWDGILRLLSFPHMSPICAISYHHEPINAIMFLNEKEASGRKYVIYCASDDGQLSCWNPGNQLRKTSEVVLFSK